MTEISKARAKARAIESDPTGIPDIFGIIPQDKLVGQKFFNSSAVRNCLQNKYVLMLGDST